MNPAWQNAWQAIPPAGTTAYTHQLYGPPATPFGPTQLAPQAQFIPCPSNYVVAQHDSTRHHFEQQQEKENKNRILAEANKSLEVEKQHLIKEIDRLKAECELLRNEGSSLEKLNQEKEARLAKLGKEKAQCEEELNKQIKGYESENKKLCRDLDHMEDELKKLIIERDQLKLDNAKLVHDADQDDAEITNCQEQLQEANSENERLRECLLLKKDEMAKHKQQLDKLREKAENFKRRCELCEEDLNKGRHALDRKEMRIKELEAMLKEALIVNQELRRELDATNTKCAIAEKQAKYAEEELKRWSKVSSENAIYASNTTKEQNNNNNIGKTISRNNNNGTFNAKTDYNRIVREASTELRNLPRKANQRIG